MATDTPHKQEFRIRDLSTRSVLLFPSQAQGTGSATITDVTVDLLPNREVYEDVYPSDSEDEDDSEEEDLDAKVEEIKSINDRIKKLNVRLLDEQEKINSAANRLKICNNFGKSVEKKRPALVDLNKLIAAYDAERKKIYRDYEVATSVVAELKNTTSET
ncbi:hypothetical protein BKA61DRAFT_575978 [Leptodontidium sp. MPI-SDFR-AT-0119]|nr:hypothetical protein BKA61DRAFT_575978 [Leptodontidium sp. MPI-SDFR-AT-0119]